MEKQLLECRENCAEKSSEICSKRDEIQSLEQSLKAAQDEISAKLNELELKGSELATLQKNLQTANTEIADKNKQIEVKKFLFSIILLCNTNNLIESAAFVPIFVEANHF